MLKLEQSGSSSVGSQSIDELSTILSQVDARLRRVELLQCLLGRLQDQLILKERYSMVVYACKKCKIDAFAVWNAWGLAVLKLLETNIMKRILVMPFSLCSLHHTRCIGFQSHV